MTAVMMMGLMLFGQTAGCDMRYDAVEKAVGADTGRKTASDGPKTMPPLTAEEKRIIQKK